MDGLAPRLDTSSLFPVVKRVEAQVNATIANVVAKSCMDRREPSADLAGRCLAHEGEEASFGLPFVQTLRERIAATQLGERKVSDLPPGSDRTHDKIVVWLKAQLFQLRLSTTGR
jgi:hypothetical protein